MRLNKNFRLEIVTIGENGVTEEDILVHDETNLDLAHIIANWTSNPDLPEPIGVIYCIDKPTYNQDMVDQINFAKEKKGPGKVQDLLNAGDTWKVS